MNMTHDEIMKLEAGRELDKLVAERVMGWTKGPLKPLKSGYYITCCKNVPYYWYSPDQPNNPQCSNDNAHGWIPPHYSTDIAAAWQVVEKMRKDGCEDSHDTEKGIFPWWMFKKGENYYSGTGETDALAICKAALLAVMR